MPGIRGDEDEQPASSSAVIERLATAYEQLESTSVTYIVE